MSRQQRWKENTSEDGGPTSRKPGRAGFQGANPGSSDGEERSARVTLAGPQQVVCAAASVWTCSVCGYWMPELHVPSLLREPAEAPLPGNGTTRQLSKAPD